MCISLLRLPIFPKLTSLNFLGTNKLDKFTIPLRFLKIKTKLLDNIDNYLEYNSENMFYLNEKLDNGEIEPELLGRVNNIVCSRYLVKICKTFILKKLSKLPILHNLKYLCYNGSIYNGCLNLDKYTIPLKFLDITDEILQNISEYLEYNPYPQNLIYLKEKL